MTYKKINPRYTVILTAGIMAFIMSGTISLALTLLAGHIGRATFTIWPPAWLKSFAIGWPIATIILPHVRRIAAALVADEPAGFVKAN